MSLPKRSCLGLISLLLVFTFLPGCVDLFDPGPIQPPRPARMGIWYRDTQGQVGYHMYATPRGNCKATWNKSGFQHISGDLPPGLYFHGSRIKGTPTQPGRWQVTVKFIGVTCMGRKYEDETVNVELNIKGYAPRKVQ